MAYVSSAESLRADLGAAMAGVGGGLAAADRLCNACVELLSVDGAAISIMHRGITSGTFGSSGAWSRRLDEMQFTTGEGPCIDAVSQGRPILVADLADRRQPQWPAFTGAALDSGVCAVFALPIAVATSHIGALDLFRRTPGALSANDLDGGLLAAELAALPLLDVIASNVGWDAGPRGDDGWDELATLQRVEVYQATGMVMASLDVDAAEALVRIRAYAFANDLGAGEVAARIVARRLVLPDDTSWQTDIDRGRSYD